jgi:hypothetical protein
VTVFPYETDNGSGFAADYYTANIFVPGKGHPSYELWLSRHGGDLVRDIETGLWKIVFLKDEDAVAFKLKYL